MLYKDSHTVFCPIILLLVVFASGCRMCGSPYDDCMSAFLDRHDDYRGCDPQYRSGSVFSKGTNDCYRGSDGVPLDRSMNAGNFGVTVPINAGRPAFGTKKSSDTAIGIPTNGFLDGNDSGTPAFTVEDMLRQETNINAPSVPLSPGEDSIPNTPPNTVPNAPPKDEDESDETPLQPIPFAVNDALRSVPLRHNVEPVITVEDLRRLDPSVTEIKILDIQDDAGVN